MAYIISLDSGTTSVRALLYNERGEALGMAQQEIHQTYPHAGWVEEDPVEIWNNQLDVTKKVIEQAGLSPKDITAIGITNQRETLIAWDKETGKPVYPAIVWQDRRTEETAAAILERGLGEWFQSRTGLIPDAYFSATKIQWLLQNVPGAREKAAEGSLLFGTIDTWLIYNATKGRTYATDYSNACRTMLFNIHSLGWDDEILEYFGLTRRNLPRAQESGSDFGMLNASYLGSEIPIRAVLGDQQSALFGQLCFEKSEAKCTYGTGAFILSNIGDKPVTSKNGLLTTVAWGLNGEVCYAFEGSIFMAGATVQWLRDNLGLIKKASETGPIASSVPDTAGVYFISSFQGLGAPWWDNGRKASIIGMTRKTNAAHIVRAALESVAYRVKDVIGAMEREMGMPCKSLKVDGGMSANDFLMQFQADVLQAPVVRSATAEATAMGAAFMAGLTEGVWKDQDSLRALVRDLNGPESAESRLYPQMEPHKAAKLYRGWLEAIGHPEG
ncbi:MAG: glycerol kinase GlpK [Firmicutes bacterium]|nr:glycerol kinase GlpK [Bacillota bacterium]